jgi:hypothetical protein
MSFSAIDFSTRTHSSLHLLKSWSLRQTRGGSNRLGSPLELSRVHWVRPEVFVEVTYLTWTEDNLLRAVSY